MYIYVQLSRALANTAVFLKGERKKKENTCRQKGARSGITLASFSFPLLFDVSRVIDVDPSFEGFICLAQREAKKKVEKDEEQKSTNTVQQEEKKKRRAS